VTAAPGIVPRVRTNENFRVPDLGVTYAPLHPLAARDSVPGARQGGRQYPPDD